MDTKNFIEKYANHPNYKSPTGNTLHAKSWQTEAPLRMFLNNLDADVAEDPSNLVVYGGSGEAARNRDSVEKIIYVLLNLEDDEKISLIEKATHEQNYEEKELFELYKRFQFNINQLLNVKD